MCLTHDCVTDFSWLVNYRWITWKCADKVSLDGAGLKATPIGLVKPHNLDRYLNARYLIGIVYNYETSRNLPKQFVSIFIIQGGPLQTTEFKKNVLNCKCLIEHNPFLRTGHFRISCVYLKSKKKILLII